MRWEDAKKTYPPQWIIIEAVDAHTEGDKRIIENIQIVELFEGITTGLCAGMCSSINYIRKRNTMWSTPHVLSLM